MRLAFKLAHESLHSHKARARFASLGIVISVFLVSLIFIISDSLKNNIDNQANTMQRNSILINGAADNNVLSLMTNVPDNTLSDEDAKSIRKALPDSSIIRNSFINGSLSFGSNHLSNITTVATSVVEPSLLKLKVSEGDWFGSDEVNKKWVILGYDLANRLIGSDVPQNQVVDIKGEKYTVVGVLQKTNRPLSVTGYNADNVAFISLQNGQALTGNKMLGQIIVNNVSDVSEGRRKASQILSQNHADPTDYSIDTSKNIAAKLVQLVNYTTIVACAFAAVILLISCVSIANTMMVGVVERRREIGIRKAVGASNRNIVGQFLAESLILSVRGAVVGLVLAYIVAEVTLIMLQAHLVFSWNALIFGFSIPIVIGIVAGAHPAHRAAKQDIITALNQLT